VSWGPAAAYAGLIFVLSSLSAPDVPGPQIPHLDKVIHFFEYAVLGALVARATLLGPPGMSRMVAVIVAFALTCAYGASDEWHQSYVPGRFSSGWDLLADSLGGAFGIAVVSRLKRGGQSDGDRSTLRG
jgi:VanZ family protein